MEHRVELRDGSLRVTGPLHWPPDWPVSAEEAVARVHDSIQSMPSTKLACGYIAHELGLDPVFLLAWVQDQRHQAMRRPAATTEAISVPVASMLSLPDGTTVRITGEVIALRMRSTRRGDPWATFCLRDADDRYVDIQVLPPTFKACKCEFLTKEMSVTVEGRKWFDESINISATNVTRNAISMPIRQ